MTNIEKVPFGTTPELATVAIVVAVGALVVVVVVVAVVRPENMFWEEDTMEILHVGWAMTFP